MKRSVQHPAFSQKERGVLLPKVCMGSVKFILEDNTVSGIQFSSFWLVNNT
jgi:hypothetical protein